jgi:hypothetical protein
MADWLPIRYADFYDVPRLFAVEHDPVFVFDCPFDDDGDEYRDTYRVLRVPSLPLSGELDFAASSGEQVGEVPVVDVEFDETRRRAIRASVLDSLDG